MNNTSIGIIGGADGPTAIMVTGEILPTILAVAAIALAIGLIVTAVVASRKNK